MNSDLKSAIIRASVATLLSLAFLTISVNGVSILSLFSPLEGHSDFQLSDLYTRVADKRPVSYCSDEVVVLATDGCSRNDIVRMVDALRTFSPVAIGVDINFRYPSEDDMYMLSVFEDCGNLVLPYVVRHYPGENVFRADDWENSFLMEWLDPGKFSVVNMERFSMFGAVRTFRPLYEVSGSQVQGFPVSLAALADGERTARFLARGHDSEYISYHSRSFEVFSYDDVVKGDGGPNAAMAEKFRDKVVIMGDVANSKDVFPVPHKEMLPGVLIHAHCVDTILSGNHIDSLPLWVNILLSVLLCFAFSFMHVQVERRMDDGVDFVMRLLQVLLMLLLYRVGCMFFIHNYYIDMSIVLLMVVTGALAKDIYVGMEQIFYRLKNKFEK